MFTCLGRIPALASFSLSHFPGTPMQSDPSFGIWSTITFGAIIVPGCPSSLHVTGCSHYPGSCGWGWRTDSLPYFSHSGQHLHVVTGPLRRFGLQVYGPKLGWLSLSHRVDLMSKCPFAPSPETTAWHTVATQQQTRRLSIFHMVFLQPGKPVFRVRPGIPRLSLHREVTASETVQMPRTHLRRTQWWRRAWFPRYQFSDLGWVADTQREPHPSTSRGECARPFVHLLACRSTLLARAILLLVHPMCPLQTQESTAGRKATWPLLLDSEKA